MKSHAIATLLVVVLTAVSISASAPATQPSAQKLAIDTKLGELSFQGESLEKAFDSISKSSGQKIVVNWRALESSKIARTLPITIDLSNQRLDVALDHLLEEVGGRYARLEYVTDGNEITISTAMDLAKNVSTRVYDIRAAIIGANAREQAVAALMQRIRGIDPLSWTDNGGNIGTIRELAGQLIITQTPQTQAKIAAYLQDVLHAGH